ncbi:beta-lactamase family protein [Sphingomonas sabuli]|uniref:Beta-lactamase family protein n=1 Tax=Sphingomonas sabuli TaxID=2764186 RepID=A0A7G9L1X9_9SPHN|nr:serine hydrolase domain-containing protein [Sphingomonas sabuli]QNM82628.1 beta-lactamase family protein [Sphingomonas sabuli]
MSSAGAAVAAVPTAPASPGKEAAASYFPPDEELQKMLVTVVGRGEVKGVVLGLLEPDGRRRIVSFGDAGTGEPPLSGDTGFEIGSITKTFTTTVLADMVRKGEVALDDPVSKYLPAGVRVPSRGGRQITLVDLATHMSGLPRSPVGYQVPDMNNPFAAFEAKHLYAFLSSYELDRDIGARFEYSNLGGGLLGHALARAAGAASIDALIGERILAPLGMSATGFGRQSNLRHPMAKGHNPQGEVVPHWTWAVLAGAGGLRSTAADMLTYLEANIGAPQSPLEAAMRDAHQPRRPTSDRGDSVALGWQHLQRGGRTIIHHGARTSGFQSYIGFDPQTGAGAIVLGNSRGFNAHSTIVLQMLRVPGAP